MSFRHDFSKREFVKQYPPIFVSSRPEFPKPRTSTYLPHLNLKWIVNKPQPESTGIVNENTRIYKG